MAESGARTRASRLHTVSPLTGRSRAGAPTALPWPCQHPPLTRYFLGVEEAYCPRLRALAPPAHLNLHESKRSYHFWSTYTGQAKSFSLLLTLTIPRQDRGVILTSQVRSVRLDCVACPAHTTGRRGSHNAVTQSPSVLNSPELRAAGAPTTLWAPSSGAPLLPGYALWAPQLWSPPLPGYPSGPPSSGAPPSPRLATPLGPPALEPPPPGYKTRLSLLIAT